ncbi:ERF family protein [Duganella aquatilis]|nr:ERF family protein [Duganella aquatilis]
MNEVLEMDTAPSQSTAIAASAAHQVAAQASRPVATNAFELVAHAAARGASMDELRTFIELQERLEANQARKAYVAAMAEFKRTPPQIMKDKAVGYYNKDGSFTGYRHSTLGAVCGAVVEALGTHGFSHRWDTEQPDSGMIAVTCAITHAMGHCETTRMVAPPDNSGKKNAIQQVASTITYLQRYTLLAACGLATNEQLDDDGRGGADNPQADVPHTGADGERKPQPEGPPPCSDQQFEVEAPKWRKTVEGGKKTPEQLLAMVSTRATFTEAQKKAILSWKQKPASAANEE